MLNTTRSTWGKSLVLAAVAGLMIPAAASAITIYQTSDDTADSNTENSFVNGVSFDPPGAPIPENDYVNEEFEMRTAGTGSTFGGNSLTLGGGTTQARLRLGRSATANSTHTWTINNLILNNAYIYSGLGTNTIACIDGNITVEAGGATFNASTGANHNKGITLLAPVGGAGKLTFHTTGNPGASAKQGQYVLSNSNTYTGGTVVGHSTSDYTFPSHLTVEADANLGDGGTIEILQNGLLTLLGVENLSINQTLVLDADLAGREAITLNYEGTSSIAGLSFDGGLTFASPGTYGAIGSGASFESDFFSGDGLIQVVPEPASATLLGAAALLALRRRRQA